ncbi:MAG: PAS domain S-box protein [Syntrophaceae bacterium]|nr:PAS domain S-box protein [Syntrophaceae bacterium]
MVVNRVMLGILEKIAGTTDAIVLIFDDAVELVWMNGAFERRLGYRLDDLKGRARWPFLSIDHEEQFTFIIHQALLGNQPDSFDIPISLSDGTRRNVRWNAMPVMSEDEPRINAVVVFGMEAGDCEQTKSDLEAAEERYRLLFENTGIAMMFITEDTTVALVNKEFEKLTGYSKAGVEGKLSWTDLIAHEADLERMRMFHRLRRIDPDLAPGVYDTKIRNRDGELRDVMIRVTMIPGTAYSLASLLDMTETRQAERATRESEQKYRALVENMQDTLYRCDLKGHLTFLSPSGASLLDYDSLEELIGKNIATDLYESPDERDRLLQELQKNGRVVNYEVTLKRRDGSLVTVSTNSHFFHDEDGNILGVEGIFSNITQRKQAEEKSRQSEEKFSTVFMTAPDCIAITRMRDGRIIDVNLGFEEITGWKRSEAIGRTSLDIRFWADPAAREFMVEELKAGRDVVQREFHFGRKDGSVRNGIYSARPINLSGESCLIFVLQDITHWRTLEEERRKLEKQLFQAQKMDAIGQLAGGVAHDFNNILMGIQGNISLLQMEHDPAHPHCRRLSRIEEHVKRGANLTRQLLGFAREGKYEVRTLSVNDLVQKSAQFFIETRREIEADFWLQEDVDPVEADAGQIEQVLLNLFINAGHAMPRGGYLHIQTSNMVLREEDARLLETKPGNYVRISISDTGVGMDRETLKRVFEPFFTTRAQEGGSGLGLASAYGIIRNHGGLINAYSEPGRGSTFNIYLPSSGEKAEEKRQSPSGELLAGSGGILLVDDEPMILEPAARMLETLGYTVYQTACGQDAVSFYFENRNRVDLVILDMILPGISGSQVLEMLKDINPEVRVILSSGYGLQGEVQKVMEAGCCGFIQKPYNYSDLSVMIQKALGPPADPFGGVDGKWPACDSGTGAA